MKRAIETAFAVALAIAAGVTSAPADELVLKFVTLDNPDAHHNVRIQHPWAERLNEQAHGLFRVQVFDGSSIANQLNVYSRVQDDVAQIAWGLPDLATGKFKLTQVVELPYLTNSSEEASVAFWRLYKTGLLDSDFDQIVPLKLIVFPQSGEQFREQPATLDNLNGLKVVVGSKITADVAAALGGAPLAFPINQYYEVLQRGTADAVQVGWTAFQPFKLAEVTKYHLDVPLGSAPGYVFMAKKKFDSLPPEVQKILMANAGEGESRQFGKFWDDVNAEWRDTTGKLPGHTLLKLTPEQDKAWHARVETVTNAWAQNQPGGEKLLATYRQLLADVRAGK
ncbi:MAG TPA: TRAP transporter substrate-binding protein DctP [Stellaceae bacterium]|jgi:TRAP-type C4-dicarboxylate transport system substrate-binding protein|nr:TRAP transporter substrate-binding protein DctP [Stellaceae bacterium]